MSSNKLLVSLLLAIITLSGHAVGQEESSFIQFFPGKKIFPRFTADGLSHGLSLSRVTENREWIGAVGGLLPLLQLNLSGATMQGSVAVTIFNRLIKTPGHLTVHTVDYRVDFPIDARFNDLALRAAVGHISCHFADDAIELSGRKSIQHVNDYVSLAAAYDVPAILGYVYGGFNYSYGTQPIPNKPWLLQVGADVAHFQLHDDVSTYVAVDVKVKEEVGWGSTRSLQLGVRLFPRLNYQLRIAYTLRMGYEDRGQYYLNRETLNLISAFLDF